MEPQKLKLKSLFTEDKKFFIPLYQRAYSWENKQLKELIEDLIQHSNGEKYFLGSAILMQREKEDDHFDIIDGQQRLTTIVILMRAILNIAKNEDFTKDIEKKYLKDKKGSILNLVDYDQDFFNSYIIENKDNNYPKTPSQERIENAKIFFISYFIKKEKFDLEKLYDTLRDSEIIQVVLKQPKESALMFELQNNRGKDLTNMEKLKSYFMYKTYCTSEEGKTNDNINQISDKFKVIYRIVQDINLKEDSILNYHNQADENLNIKIGDGGGFETRLEKIKTKIDNPKEIIKYCEELKITFQNLRKFQSFENDYKERLYDLNKDYFYPFIIKGYRYFQDEKKLSILCRILEIVIFRYRLINTKAYFVENIKINEILKAFQGNLKKLRDNFKEALNKSYFWDDAAIFAWNEEHEKGEKRGGIDSFKIYFESHEEVPYILKQYEKSLDNKGYVTKILKLQIEHIAPQKEPISKEQKAKRKNTGQQVTTTERFKPIKPGYGKYTKGFEDKYLHCIGNLMLISKSHNCSIGNKPFKEKLKSYKKTPTGQMQEIASFASEDKKGNPFWDSKAIKMRKKAIIDFARKEWKFENIEIE